MPGDVTATMAADEESDGCSIQSHIKGLPEYFFVYYPGWTELLGVRIHEGRVFLAQEQVQLLIDEGYVGREPLSSLAYDSMITQWHMTDDEIQLPISGTFDLTTDEVGDTFDFRVLNLFPIEATFALFDEPDIASFFSPLTFPNPDGASAGSPVFGTPLLRKRLFATALIVSSPVLGGTAVIKQKHKLTASSFAVSSPVIGQGHPMGVMLIAEDGRILISEDGLTLITEES